MSSATEQNGPNIADIGDIPHHASRSVLRFLSTTINAAHNRYPCAIGYPYAEIKVRFLFAFLRNRRVPKFTDT